MNATTVAVDLAKSVFQLAVADSHWRVVETHRLTRTQFERWFVNRDVSLVVMEACGSAHHWARYLLGLGLEVKLLPAKYVRAYVKRNKTDAADAAALLEAARASDITPVRVKSVEQQALQGLHRTRSLWMGTRTSRINALRGFCREFGLAIPQGSRTGVEAMARLLADPGSAIPELIRGSMKLLIEEIRLLEQRIAQLEKELTGAAKLRLQGIADCAGDWFVNRHCDGCGYFRRGRSLPGCASLRQLVWAHAQGIFLGQYATLGAYIQTGGPISADVAYSRRTRRTPGRHGGQTSRQTDRWSERLGVEGAGTNQSQ